MPNSAPASGAPSPGPGPGPGQISVTAARERALAGQAVILDVREADEYAAGHAPGAAWQTLAALAAGVELPKELARRELLVICRSGNRSRRAAELLALRGVDALNVVGGMQAWAAAGLPVRDAVGDDGDVI